MAMSKGRLQYNGDVELFPRPYKLDGGDQTLYWHDLPNDITMQKMSARFSGYATADGSLVLMSGNNTGHKCAGWMHASEKGRWDQTPVQQTYNPNYEYKAGEPICFLTDPSSQFLIKMSDNSVQANLVTGKTYELIVDGDGNQVLTDVEAAASPIQVEDAVLHAPQGFVVVSIKRM